MADSLSRAERLNLYRQEKKTVVQITGTETTISEKKQSSTQKSATSKKTATSNTTSLSKKVGSSSSVAEKKAKSKENTTNAKASCTIVKSKPKAAKTATLCCNKKSDQQTIGVDASGATLVDKLNEAAILVQFSGIDVARTYLEELPKEEGMEKLLKQPIYWLSWIKIEGDSNNWDNVKALFDKAIEHVDSAAGKKALQVANEQQKSRIDEYFATKQTTKETSHAM